MKFTKITGLTEPNPTEKSLANSANNREVRKISSSMKVQVVV